MGLACAAGSVSVVTDWGGGGEPIEVGESLWLELCCGMILSFVNLDF